MAVLGLLPAIRGGLGDLARTGQHSRLLEGYVRPYTRAFEEVRYFSYLRESLADFTGDPEVLARARLLPGSPIHPWVYAFLLPLRHRRALGGCSVLRVFQVTGTIPAVIAKRLFGVPFVTTYGFWYASLARTRASRLLRNSVERVGLAAADAVIVTTPELGVHVRRRRPTGPVHVIPNGVDTDRFRPGRRLPRETARLLYVGRLSPEKNLGALIAAAGALGAKRPVEVVLVGDGPARPALQAEARAAGVAATFRPFVDHREVPAVMADADAFVLPSFTEGHPKVLLEAMSCGVPCVASDVGGNRSIVAPGATGLLFDPADVGGLVAALEHVLADGDEARRLGDNARAAVVARYDLAALVEQEIALLVQLARGR